MTIIGWIVAGLIIGALAKLVMPGDDPGGIVVTTLLGIAGAVVGGAVGRALGLYGPARLTEKSAPNAAARAGGSLQAAPVRASPTPRTPVTTTWLGCGTS
jgi:uncharacterized membrane protein YeaQ/YmgE (transglycosylase-associated protein family)